MAKFNPYVLNFSDLGEVYQKEQDRILKREEEAMAWYDQIVEERGPFTEGTREQLNNLFGQIDEELTLGNATPQGRAKIKKLYNEYRDVAANALNYSQDIDKALIEVRTNPGSYSDPEIRVQELEEMRFAPVDLRTLASKKVDLSPYRLYDAPPIMAPIDQAKYLIDTIGGQFYEKGMKLGDTDIKNLITDELLLSANNPENIAKMIAYKYGEDSLRTLGGKQRLERLVRQEDESSKKEFVSLLTDYAIEVGDSLNLILTEQDKILTEREASNQAYRDKLYIKQAVEGDIKDVSYEFSPFKVVNEKGNIISLPISMSLNPFETYFAEGQENVRVIRKAVNEYGEEGFIGTKDIETGEFDSEAKPITKTVDSFYTIDQLPAASSDMEKANKGSENAFILEKDRYSKGKGFNTRPDPSNSLDNVFKKISEEDMELVESYIRRKNIPENNRTKKFYLDQKEFDSKSNKEELIEIADNLVIERNKEEEDKIYKSVEKKLDLKLKGNDAQRDESRELISDFIQKKKEDIFKDEEGVSQEAKIRKFNLFLQELNKKKFKGRSQSLEQVKEIIKELNEMSYEKGGRVSNETTLGKIFNRVKKALIPS